MSFDSLRRDATGMTLMTETVAPVAKPVARPRSRKPAIVTASALALSANFSWVWSPTPGFSATTLRTSPYATAA
jgi:hypothetical protein